MPDACQKLTGRQIILSHRTETDKELRYHRHKQITCQRQ